MRVEDLKFRAHEGLKVLDLGQGEGMLLCRVSMKDAYLR